MTYFYCVLTPGPNELQKELNRMGEEGYKLVNVQTLVNHKGFDIAGQPKIDLTYQCIMIKEDN